MPIIPRLILHEDHAKMLCHIYDDDQNQRTDVTHMETTSDENASALSNNESVVVDVVSGEPSSQDASELSALEEEHIDLEDPPLESEDVKSSSENKLSAPDCSEHRPQETEHAPRNKRNPPRAKEIVLKAAKTTGKVAKKTETVAEKTVKLPHLASNHWSHNLGIVLLQAAGCDILSMISPAIKLESVNAGLSSNRIFLYGAHTLVELFLLLPFVASCHYAIEDAGIPLVSRFLAVLVGLCLGKTFLAIIAEAWWSPDVEPIFPVPFSFVATMMVSVPSSLVALWFMTPRRLAKHYPAYCHRVREKFGLCIGMLFLYMLSLLVACVWAVLFRQLTDWPVTQPFMMLLLNALEFVFKIVCVSNLTTRLNGKKWIQLNLVVDLIFASVQTAVLPYFSNFYSVSVSVLFTMITIAWRVYAGVDRLGTFISDAGRVVSDSSGPRSAVRGIGRLAARKATSPVKDNIPMSMRMLGNVAELTIQDWGSESSDEMCAVEAQEQKEDDDEDSNSAARIESFDDSRSSTDLGVSSEEARIDRRALYQSERKKYIRNSGLREITEEQRHLFHIVDAVSSSIIITVVRLTSIILSALIRHLPIREHLNASFQISDDQFISATMYGFVYIVGVVLVLLGVGVYLRKGADLGGLTLNRIISFTFRDSFWFFLIWYCWTLNFLYALQVNHFGVDFTLKFDWLDCREAGQMAWPGCACAEYMAWPRCEF